MSNSSHMNQEFPFQVDEFYLDLQEDGSKISKIEMDDIARRPFPGLRSYKTSEFQLFKGRDGQAEELIKRLKRNHFLSVIGSSGTGKSSLVRAGLIPQLYGGYLHEAGNKWNVAICRPGKDPIENLSIALSNVKSRSKEKHKILEEYKIIQPLISKTAYGILEVNELLKATRPKDENANLLIIIDQFEELFRFKRKDLGREDVEHHFVNLLLKASLKSDSSVYVIITMRSEFLGDCVKYRGLPEAINDGQYLVPQLGRTQLKSVIEGPIALAGKKISPGLVELLVNEIEESKLKENLDQLPILQHALMRTYNEAMKDGPETEISYEHYKLTGGMDKALANHAEAKYNELGDEKSNETNESKKQKIAKIVFQALTDASTDQKGGRRPIELKHIYAIAASLHASNAEVDEVINHFRDYETSFIMPPVNTSLYPDLMIDISHESLMRNWDRLNKWIAEEVRFGKLYKTLQERRELCELRMDEWIRGGLLEDMLSWHTRYPNNAAWAWRYDDLNNGKNEDRIVQEAYDKNIDFLNESKSRVETAKKREAKRKRLIISVFAIATVISTTFGLFAFKESKEATAQKIKATDLRDSAIVSEQKAKRQKNMADSLKNIAEEAEQSVKFSQARLLSSYNDVIEQKTKAVVAEIKARKAEGKADSLRNDIEIRKNKEIAVLKAEKSAEEQTYNLMKDRFESECSTKDWWDNTLSHDMQKYITDTLFKLYNLSKDSTSWHKDSAVAIAFENSLRLVKDAKAKQTEDWGTYLYLLDQAKKYSDNLITSQALEQSLQGILPYHNKILQGRPAELASMTYRNIFSGGGVTTIRFLPNSTESFIVGNTTGFYLYERKYDSLRPILRLFGEIPATISPDATKLLTYDTYLNEFAIYDANKNYPNQKDNIIQKINGNPKLNRRKKAAGYNYYRHDHYLRAAFSPNNNFLATYDALKNDLILYDLINSNSKLQHLAPGTKVVGFDFSRDGKKLLVCMSDSAYVINSNTFQTISRPLGNNNTTTIAKSSLDLDKGALDFLTGKFSPATDSVVEIFSNSNGYKWKWQEDNSFSAMGNPNSLSYDNIFLPLAKDYFLVNKSSTSNDPARLIKVLDTSFKLLKIFPWHQKDVEDAAISTDGKWIASADNGEIFLWNISDSLIREEDIGSYTNKTRLKAYYMDKGDKYSSDKKWNSAIINYNSAVQQDSADAKLYYSLGWAYINLKNYSLADIAITRSLSLDSGVRNTWDISGISYHNQRKYDQAIASYKRAIELDSSNGVLWNNIGKSYYSKKVYDTAIIALQKALAFGADISDVLIYLANAYDYKGKYDSAIRYYRKAAAAEPNKVVYVSYLADAYNDNSQYDSALIILKEALMADSSGYEPWNYIGNAYNGLGKYEIAIENYKKALSIDSTSIDIISNLGKAYNHLKKYDTAIFLLNRGLKSDTSSGAAWNTLGLAYDAKKKYSLAIASFKRAIAIDSNYSTYWVNIGSSYFSDKQIDTAIKCIHKAIDIDSSGWLGWNGLSYHLDRMGKYEAALPMADSAIKHITKNVKIANPYAHKGYALLKLGRYQEAFYNINLAKDIDSNYDKVYFYLACYFAIRNDKQAAIKNLRIAIEKGFDDYEWMMKEDFLVGIRSEQEYDNLVGLFHR